MREIIQKIKFKIIEIITNKKIILDVILLINAFVLGVFTQKLVDFWFIAPSLPILLLIIFSFTAAFIGYRVTELLNELDKDALLFAVKEFVGDVSVPDLRNKITKKKRALYITNKNYARISYLLVAWGVLLFAVLISPLFLKGVK